ncbi:MAG TPA: hypothetical protein VLY04_00530, partial [Bryobacteraceae bacterium]|nr:hypothetical protein [Bryobacteraceae bacterium]
AIAHLKADLVAVYQPVNSQELFAIERIALAQQALLRAAALESGLFTTCLDTVMARDGGPYFLMEQDLIGDIEVTRAQNRNYLLAEGFHRTIRTSNSWSLFLRYQAQAERHYRRAIEEFERLKRLRKELPNEPILEAEPDETEPLYIQETNPFRDDAVDDASAPDPAANPDTTAPDHVPTDGASIPAAAPAEAQAAPPPPNTSSPLPAPGASIELGDLNPLLPEVFQPVVDAPTPANLRRIHNGADQPHRRGPKTMIPRQFTAGMRHALSVAPHVVR